MPMPRELAEPERRVVAGGAVQHEQAEEADGDERQQQRAVEVQCAQQARRSR